MKRLFAWLAIGVSLLNPSFATTSDSKGVITFGIGNNTTSNGQAEWADIFSALKNATGKEINVVNFQNQGSLLQAVENNKMGLAYIKVLPAEIAIKSNPHIKILAVAASKHPISGKEVISYDAYIITAKNSDINNLQDLNNKTLAYYDHYSASSYVQVKQKLADAGIKVNWIKVDSPEAAFTAIEQHHADATGAWDYFYNHSSDKDKFKILAIIPNLPHPVLVFNETLLSKEDVDRIKHVLRHIKAHADVAGFKPV